MALKKGDKQYTLKDKIKILNYYDKNGRSQTIEKFGVSNYSITNWNKLRKNGKLNESNTGRKKKTIIDFDIPFEKMTKEQWEEQRDFLRSLVEVMDSTKK